MGEPKTLYIIDGHSQIFRAYYAPFRDLTSPTGEPTRATYVFCTMLLKMVNEYAPDYIVMAADGPHEALRRRAVYAEYKATRKPTPDDFGPQVRRIRQIVELMGIPIVEAEGYEADDVIATLVEQYKGREDLKLVVVSRDKDLDQIVGGGVVLYDPMKDEFIDEAGLVKEKGYPPAQAVEVQALMGDTSDNVPGVPGVGGKTAAKLIAQYGNIEGVIAHAAELSPKLRANVEAAAQKLPLSRELVRLERDAPVACELDRMAAGGVVNANVLAVFKELGFTRLLDQLAVGQQHEHLTAPAKVEQIAAPAAIAEYHCVDTPEKLGELVKKLAAATVIGVDTQTNGVLPLHCSFVGLSMAWAPCAAAYIPLRGPMGEKTLPVELVREKLGPILADEKTLKVGHNLKFDLLVLGRAGMPLGGPMFDTLIAAHVLDSTRPSFRMDTLAAELLEYRCVPLTDIIGAGRNQITMDTAPVEAVCRFAAEAAEVPLRLYEKLLPRLREEKVFALFENLEMKLMPVLAQMERTGIIVDPQTLKSMETTLAREADALREQIIAMAGEMFNPDSPKQLADVLFNKLKLPIARKTKTGASTDSAVLEDLAVWHELPGLVLEYRKLTKLLSTYLMALAECIHPETRRVHTNFWQTVTVTGRLSSSEPNLQNIPIRTELGRQIRSAFVAPPGSMLLAADYSQVELRVLAHMADEETLKAAFAQDHDIHRIVAAEVFGIKEEDVTPHQRSRAKTVNFGIIYGQTAFGLAKTLRIGRGEAGEFITAYRKRFPKIDNFLQECIARAKRDGYVETILGRRRRIPEIDARNPQKRAAAERLAINSTVQGSAADIIKTAMVKIDRGIRDERRPTKMLLQIHDELVFEIIEGAVEAEREWIIEEMTGAIHLSVPLKVEAGVGHNWMEAK